jgi:Protein of unknown function (DUF4019)
MLLSAGAGLAWAQDEKARQEAEKWLAMVDRGEYANCWKRASKEHRSQVTQGEWVTQVKTMRDGAGKLTERKMTVARPAKSLAGFPDGEYLIMEYTSEFAGKPRAVETVVLVREGRGWNVAGYVIR